MDFEFNNKENENTEGQQPEMEQTSAEPQNEAPRNEVEQPEAPTSWQDAAHRPPESREEPEAPRSDWQSDMPQPGWNTEPCTPYQTPVRETPQQYASYEQWRQATAQQANVRQTGQESGEQPFSTYEEWQRQQFTQNGEGGKPPKQKKSHKRLWIGLGSTLAACMLVAAGVGIGSQMGNQPYSGGAAVYDAKPTDPSKPNVTITDSPSTTGTGEDNGLTGEQIYEKVSPSVVSVVSASLTNAAQSSGSGVIMSTDGYVITNHHVIADAQKVTVLMADGIQYNAEVIGSDEATDLAVLKITNGNGVKFQAAEFGDSSKIKAGQRAYALGSPGGVELANTITSGSISAISRDVTIDDRVMTLIQTDASINPGNSGGALINPYGQVIGITSAKLGISYYEGLGFAIPIDSAKEIVDQLIQHGYVPGRPAIGISGSNLSKEIAAYNNVPQGVLVRVVDARAGAAQAGLQINDIITGVNGKTVTTMDEVNEAKGDLKAGDKLTLTVYRISTGKTIDITITLADQHDLAEQQTAEEPVLEAPVQEGGENYGNGGNGSYFQFPW